MACVKGFASGSPSRSIDRGPWTARSAYSSEASRTSEPRISRSLIQAYAASRLPALTTTR